VDALLGIIKILKSLFDFSNIVRSILAWTISAVGLVAAIMGIISFIRGPRSTNRAIRQLRDEVKKLSSKISNDIVSRPVSSKDTYIPAEPSSETKQEAESLLERLEQLRKVKEDLPPSVELDEGIALIGKGEYQKGIEKIDDYLARMDQAWKRVEAQRDEELFLAYKSLGDAEYYQVHYDKAFDWYKKALELKPDDQAVLNSAGLTYLELGKPGTARKYFEDALDAYVKGESNDTTDYAMYLNNLGSAFKGNGEYDQALDIFNQALALNERRFGKYHLHVARDYNNIGGVFHAEREYEKALYNFTIALEINLKLFGEEHSYVASGYNNIGSALESMGELDKAVENFNKALNIDRSIFGNEHSHVAKDNSNIGNVLVRLKKYDQAITHYMTAIGIFQRLFRRGHPDLAIVYQNIAQVYYQTGNLKKGLPFIIGAFKIFYQFLGPDHPRTINAKLGIELHGGDPEAVERELREEGIFRDNDKK
jgi:tetratricopeptide (TPR) repeat protein